MEQLNSTTASHFSRKLETLLSLHSSEQDLDAQQEQPEFTEGAREKVLLASYPRSGNTLIRSYLEKITGIITGSDHIIDLKLNRDLFELGMAGEGKIDDTVWIVKSHYPERLGHTPLHVNRCVLMVRSPFDSLWSFFNMMATQSHNQSIHADKIALLKEMWEIFVVDELQTWKEFHDYWISAPQKIPTYIIRYEDLLSSPDETLKGLFEFLLNREALSLNGTVIEKAIKEVSGGDKPQVYKPRSGKVNASLLQFSEDQIDYIRKEIYPYLQKFGYLKATDGEQENPTGFVEPLSASEGATEKYQGKEWLDDFNSKMKAVSIKLRQKKFPDEEEYLNRVSTLISDRKEIEKYKLKKSQGWRAQRQKIKDVMNSV